MDKINNNKLNNITISDLDKALDKLFEYLGLMTWEYELKNENKINSYLNSIKKIKIIMETKKRINSKITPKLNSNELKHLDKLLEKTEHLYKYANKLFIEKSICDCIKCTKPLNKSSKLSSRTNKFTRLIKSFENNKLNSKTKTDSDNKTTKSIKSKPISNPIKKVQTSKNIVKSSKINSKTNTTKLAEPIKPYIPIIIKKTSKSPNKILSKKSSKKLSKKPSKIFKKM